MFLTKGPNRIGSRYKKVRYVEYTDDRFLTKMLRSPEEEHLGILGKLVLQFFTEENVLQSVKMLCKSVLSIKIMY